ncbi:MULTISPECIES: hypothetical protein [unclassified Streptomyces]|uniref:hypothetical protein n=1 Tax=unclassified Streptomyces TaxID=2593676 RepID=UPI000375B68B|nr:MULTISPECIES: hypothetical protein [unclassified Streptomyces]MYX36918.1 hypothetical protein [Streptomyces sp. SID8377]
MSPLLHRLLHSARVYAQTALEVAVLGAGDELMNPDPAVSRAAATTGRPPGADTSATAA